MKNLILFLFLYLALGTNMVAQSGKNFFDPNVVHEINLTFSEEGFWDSLLVFYGDSSSFSGSDIEWLMADKIEIDGTVLDSVGVRMRGKSSFKHASKFKKPFKIDLNEFVKGQDYDGMKKFNLHNGACDPGQLRDFIAYDVMRTSGVKAPRVAHGRLSINGQYWGLYSIIEQIDKTFVKNNFSSGNGDLYKNNAWSQLEWLGTNLSFYQEDIELKTNEEDSDWSDFLELVDVLNNTPDDQFEAAIQKVFNVENYLRVLAVDIALNNWDSYVENQRNWYIYHNPSTDLFEWIPWDYNLSMGGDFSYSANPYRPLSPDCDLLAEFQYYRQGEDIIFLDKSEPRAQELSWNFGNGRSSNLPNPVINFQELTETEVCLTVKRLEGNRICEHTRCHKIEFDFDVAECRVDSGGQVSPYPTTDPVFQIVTREDEFCCSESWDAVCEAKYQDFLTGQDTIGELGIEYFRNLPLFTEDSSKVLIVRLLNVPAFKERFLELYCVLLSTNFTKERITGLIERQTALIRPEIYEEPYPFFSKDFYEYDVGNGSGGGHEVNIPPLKYFIERRIPQLVIQLILTGKNCEAALNTAQFQDISINEFVVSNIDSLGGQADSEGEFDDWIELFNNTNSDFDLTGYFMTDKLDQPLKWTFPPNTIIPAKDYLIVWADKDEEQAGIHSNFKLDKDGEALMLSHEDGTILDSLTFGGQTTNMAMARIPNGTGGFEQQVPTFDRNNELVSSLETSLLKKEIIIYPNPANEQITIDFGELEEQQNCSVSLHDIMGRLLFQQSSAGDPMIFHTEPYPNGIYLLEVKVANEVFSKKVIIEH